MKVNIVNYEQGRNNGILTKFAVKLHEQLQTMGVDSKISPLPDPEADVNHHINYLPYKYERSPNTINTLMVTHIFEGYKLDAIREQIKTADKGICMSTDTEKQLVKWGLPQEKLTTILPAHDGKPRRFQVVAILTNVYPDGCKREHMFRNLVKTLDLNKWAFRIMGTGWSEILIPLVAEGLQVDYFNDFNPDIHQKILETSDYALYFGEDEGSMGLLDAVNAGLKTIAPPVGFNIDMGVDYPFKTQEELNEIFTKLNPNRVETWTWPIHAKQHLNIWNEALEKRK